MHVSVNPNATIVCMHSARGTQTIEVKWSRLGWEYLGSKNPELPRIVQELAETGRSTYTDESGTLTMRTNDPMYLESTA